MDTATGFPAEIYPQIKSWPSSVEPRQLSLHPVPNSTSVMSPFTGAMQSEPMPGTRWQLSASFDALDVDQVRQVRALVMQMRGMSGRFYFLAEPGKRGTIAPQPPLDNLAGVVNAGPRIFSFFGFSGGVLQTTGWTQGIGELVYQAGDYVSVDDAKGCRRLFMLLEDCYAGADGAANFEVTPSPIGLELPADSALHHGGNASGVFYMDDDEQGQITEEPGATASLSISATEFLCPNVFRMVS